MPAHIRFLDLLQVPFASVRINVAALVNTVTDARGIKSPVSPVRIYKSLEAAAKRRELPVQDYDAYRTSMDRFNPADRSATVTVPKENWDLYLRPCTMFDAAILTHFSQFARMAGYSFTLILNRKMDQLKRIEVMGPQIPSPSMIWINGKGTFPNAEVG